MLEIRRDSIEVAKVPTGLTASDAMRDGHERLLWQLNPGGSRPEIINLQRFLSDDGRDLIVAVLGNVPETDYGWEELSADQFIGTLSLIDTSSLTRNTGKIEHVVTDKNFRQLGIGKRLVGKALERAADRGFSRVELTSNETREDAQLLYASMGFKTRDTVNWRWEKTA